MLHEPSSFMPSPSNDSSQPSAASSASVPTDPNDLLVDLLQQMVVAQDRQNELLEELVEQISASHRQKATELGQWKQANPHLARSCRHAAETLGQVQTHMLENLTEEVNDNPEGLMQGEFLLTEFVDRYGPRLVHLNGVLQILSQLSSVPNTTTNTQ